MRRERERGRMAGNMKIWIQLHRDRGQFWPGEMVKGYLFVQTLASPHSLSQLTLALRGEAEVLIERHDYLLKKHYRYTQRELYVDTQRSVQRMTVVPNPEMLTTGVHVFEFELMLPAGIPPSFRGRHGDIKYSLSVSRNRKCVYRMIIGVLASLNVLGLPGAQDVVMREADSVTGGCFFPKQHDVSVRVWLDRMGCYIGGKIPLHVQINNGSDIMVNYTRLTLRRTIQFLSHDREEKTTYNASEVSPVRLGRVVPHSGSVWDPDDVNFALPVTLPVSGLPGCSVIRLSYELVVKVVMAGCVSGVTFRLPILIGSAPPESVQRDIQKNVATQRATTAAALLCALGLAVDDLQEAEQEAGPSYGYEA